MNRRASRWLTFLASVCWGFLNASAAQKQLTNADAEQIRQRAVAPETIGLSPTGASGQDTIDIGEKIIAAPPVTVPLWRLTSDLPAVGVRLNGKRLEKFIIDTGAMVNVIQASVALKNDVDIADPTKLNPTFNGIAGRETLYLGRIAHVECGKLTGTNLFTAIRLQSYEQRLFGFVPISQMGFNLLGMSTLSRLSYFTINPDTRNVTFASAEDYPEPSSKKLAARVPLEFTGRQLFARVRVNSTNEIRALVDTGNSAGLMINSRRLAELGLTTKSKAGSAGDVVALGGEKTFATFTLPRMEMGYVTFKNVAAMSGPGDFDVLLGSGLFRKYKTTIDMRRKILWLEYAR